ncbi:MAG: hypothetical protein JSU70_22560 [Phycisphaerales bacterium]|nr:MAG: hypothetical protein JSU70_22560 [Phycisphaerales bacterium]
MEERSRKQRQSQANLKDFVVVTLVDDMDQARDYESLLRVNDIPAVIKEQIDPALSGKGIALMVPEDCLDEAHVVIESQDAYDDFYDFALEDEDDGDLDSDLLDEDF